jgi:tRNA(Ile)-lysidine synthase
MRFSSGSRPNNPVRTAEPAGPIGDRELNALFASLTSATGIAIAVSGGSDSLALLDCVDRWRSKLSHPPKVIVLTVDHGLRKSSGREAAAVLQVARKRGIAGKVLRWTGEKPRSDIEAAARAARYRLLLGAARQAGASHLLLGHHRDDQAETLLLRLARGSGLFGLAAMRSEIPVDDVTIVRPFLEIPKVRLAETIAVAGLTPAEDAMNTDSRFARARLRRIMPLLAADGIDPAGLAATARRLAGAAEAIDAAATTLIGNAVGLDAFAVASLDRAALLAAPREVRLRLVVRLLLAIGGDDYPPRFEKLSALVGEMERHDAGGRFKRTLSGAVIEWRGGRFVVYREVGRSGLPKIQVRSGSSGIWDHRFRFEIGRRAPAGLVLAALGEEGRRAIGVGSGTAAPGVLAALPALWGGGKVLAVPTVAYRGQAGVALKVTVSPILAERLAEPPQFPDFLAPN